MQSVQASQRHQDSVFTRIPGDCSKGDATPVPFLTLPDTLSYKTSTMEACQMYPRLRPYPDRKGLGTSDPYI